MSCQFLYESLVKVNFTYFNTVLQKFSKKNKFDLSLPWLKTYKLLKIIEFYTCRYTLYVDLRNESLKVSTHIFNGHIIISLDVVKIKRE